MKTARLISITGVLQLIPHHIMACSGEGAGALIAFNVRVGYSLFILSLFIVTAIFIIRRKKNRIKKSGYHPAVVFVLMIFHPAVWLDGLSGDCGYLLFDSSIVATCVLLVILIWTWFRARKHLRKIS